MKTKRPILLTLLLLLTVALLGFAQVAPSLTPTSPTATGRAVFAVADAAVYVFAAIGGFHHHQDGRAGTA